MCLCLKVKNEESEGIHKQLSSTIEDLTTKMNALKKENEYNKLTVEKEREQNTKLAVSRLYSCDCCIRICDRIYYE